MAHVESDHVIFDALRGVSAPTHLFGRILGRAKSETALRNLEEHAQRSVARIVDKFQRKIAFTERGVGRLDQLIHEMWENDWSPETGNVNLFAADFGSIFAIVLLRLRGVEPVFRSSRLLNEMSVWQPKSRTEYFLFHKAAKCLMSREGETMLQLYRAAAAAP